MDGFGSYNNAATTAVPDALTDLGSTQWGAKSRPWVADQR
jgi:hypothetical protein